jgi:hypothetical protein
MRRLHLQVTPFSAATILVFAIASPLHAQGIEVFGGYSVNADYVQNRLPDQRLPATSICFGVSSCFGGCDTVLTQNRAHLQDAKRCAPVRLSVVKIAELIA